MHTLVWQEMGDVGLVVAVASLSLLVWILCVKLVHRLRMGSNVIVFLVGLSPPLVDCGSAAVGAEDIAVAILSVVSTAGDGGADGAGIEDSDSEVVIVGLTS